MGFEFPQDGLNLGPLLAELFGLVGAPIGPGFLGKLRGLVEVSACKIEDERAVQTSCASGLCCRKRSSSCRS